MALERGVHVTAVDAAPAMVDLLRHDHPEVDCRVMDAQCLEFAEDTFDAVVSAFVVHVVRDPQALITNAVRVVRPGGLVALIVPGRGDEEPDEWRDPVQEVVREYREFQPDGVVRHTGRDYKSEELLMVDAGLVALVALVDRSGGVVLRRSAALWVGHHA